MTMLTNYRPYYEVLVRVGQVRARMRSVRVWKGAMCFVTVLCGTVLAAGLAQGFLRFGAAGRLALLVGGGAAIAASFWRGVILPLRYDPNDKEVARFVETRLPELGNNLINALLLTEDAERWLPALVERAVGEAAAGARGVRLTRAVSGRTAKRWAVAAAVATVLLGLYTALAPGRFVSAGLQILSPFRHVASVGAVVFDSIRPENAVWIKGEPMDIEAVIAGSKGRLYEGYVEIREDATGRALRKDLVRLPDRPRRFTCRIPQVLQPFTYRLNVGGTESSLFHVTLREPVLIEQIDVRYAYPEYTGLAPRSVDKNGGEVRCLVGTQVKMTVCLSARVAGGTLLFGSGKEARCVADESGRALTAHFGVFQDDTYQIHLAGEAPNGAAVMYRIVALPDEPPAVKFTLPRRDVVAGPGGAVKMGLKAADRYGLGEVRLLAQSDGEAQSRQVAVWKTFADPKESALDAAFPVDVDRYPVGRTITYWAEARDRRAYQGGDTPRGPNVATTAKFKIFVQDKEAAAEQRLDQLSRLFERLRAILKTQQEARTRTLALPQRELLEDVRSAGVDLERMQRSIRTATGAVSREVVFDEQTMPVKEVLLVLSANEMASAITKARAIGEVSGPAWADGVGDRAAALAVDQDRIIATLRQILDIVPKLADAVREEKERLEPSDLPPETLAKLNALRERLKEFIDEQKKVIEASKELAKRPVDDFTDPDQRELARLKAIEDDWDKFLTERIADFSKIPDLDASNPSLVRELIEVKVDVEMAADALARKAMDVVVPLEELGMEGAEEIVENLERWLPDTPDRKRWQQEEATGEAEIPHAELPEQMEDLVAELLEEEEDLFDEIEDVTSGAADSADKGAGWDAMDGPISNYSAKGVTGNHLPNTSEVGGRSGEGRTGKSSGEFIEETATGKGGRRTPTRLSPDAFSQGEVKDSSGEAPTGATGGGKISGAGTEGLEGPVPPEIQRRMELLAARQAQLRNKAEGVRAALKVRNYESFSLDDAVQGMRRAQRDLLAGRHRSALRHRDIILDNLKSTKMLLTGEVRIRRDTSAALPDEVRDEVLDALEKPMPRGYEQYLKRYYQRLSEGP